MLKRIATLISLGLALALGACLTPSGPAKSQGTPCQWNYTLAADGSALATYCGAVQSNGGSFVIGPNPTANPTPPQPSYPIIWRWVDSTSAPQSYRMFVALGDGTGRLDTNCTSTTCEYSWNAGDIVFYTNSAHTQAAMVMKPIPISGLLTCQASRAGAISVVNNGIAAPTIHQAVSATGPATWNVECITADGSTYAWVYM